MSTMFKELGLFTYESYLKQFEEWVKNNKTSTQNSTKALIEFTKLNFARTQSIHKTILIKQELMNAIKKIQNNYSWIVLTEAWCGDSAQNLPVIAEIARLNSEKIKLYILLRDENSEMMDHYLTNNAIAILKLIVVNETMGKEAFVWGPRPLGAQELLNAWKSKPEGKSWDEFEKELHSWYAKDRTQSLRSEFIELLHSLQ